MSSRILIVEDERITAEDLHDILTGLGYHVTAIASSGAEAIKEAEQNPPDLALMDIRIKGDMDGTETARILNERFDIPVVYLTAHADRETLQRAKRAKPLGYIVKPFQESELQASLEIALHRHGEDKKARERTQQLTELLSSLILGVIWVDETELIAGLNSSAEEMTGYEKAEAVGQQIRRIFRIADLQTGDLVDLPMAALLGNMEMVELDQKWLISKDGTRRAVSGNISAMRGAKGVPIGALVVFEQVPDGAEKAVVRSVLQTAPHNDEIRIGRFHMLAHSEEMKRVLTFALRIARSEANTILIEGESGTGKDLLAQFIHYSSTRRAGPFVPVNCSAIPENMVESELFGHERGAFQDAKADKKGLFEIANGGTLFLDEIGELSPAMQAKLLRVLDEQSFRRLGSTKDIRVDVRVIAATNPLLSVQVQAGDFRLDLFHRLSIVQMVIPALRQRPDDILPLATQFIRQNNVKYRGHIEGITDEAAAMLLAHAWPGNVRELRNVIERAALVEEAKLLRPSSIHFVSLPVRSEMEGAAPKAKESWSLRDTERTLVMRAMEKTGGNQSKAAKLLGITRDMLRYRMKKMDLRAADIVGLDV
ncbi:MAG: sigma 54-interacting transcriptional regulator [Bryobacteraceae bacterium]